MVFYCVALLQRLHLHEDHEGEEDDEGPVVVPGHAVAHPGAVVVHHLHAAVAHRAVLRPHHLRGQAGPAVRGRGRAAGNIMYNLIWSKDGQRKPPFGGDSLFC